MRTTIDLPQVLHRQAVSIARDTSRTLSETVADLMRRGLGQALDERAAGQVEMSARTGLPVIRVGQTITSEAVRVLEDDD